mgnify:FL=1
MSDLKDIKVKRVAKSFGAKCVLDGYSAVFPAGRITCLMGESGCGKTTLLNLILGLIKPDGGEISGVPDKLAAVFQENRLCDDFSALTNVRIIGASVENARETLIALGLGDSLSRPVRELSGGMKRRVAIARALCADCELMVMDEPFKGLDDVTRRHCIDEVRSRMGGRTAIVVTHDREDAEMLGAEIITMKSGGCGGNAAK